ncbi:MAG: DUF6057 family protein [Bacteroidales bacterium]|nr:DUF6057 family protein [Bacteroidales bacterium]
MLHKRHITILVVILFAVVVCCLWRFCHWGQMNYHEQLQLFLLTPAFFIKTLFSVGGLADYISQFLTQFFVNHWVGACIIALGVSLVQILSLGLIRRVNDGIWGLALSLAPLVASYCVVGVAESLLTSLVAMVFGLIGANIVLKIKPNNCRYIVLSASSVLMYMLAGTVAILLMVLGVIVVDCLNKKIKIAKAILITIALLIEWLAIVGISHMYGEYGVDAYIQGIYYLRNPMQVNVVLYVCVAIVIGTIILAKISVRSEKLEKILISVAVLVIIGLGAKASAFCYRQDFENMLRYDYLCRQKAWDEMIAIADVNAPEGMTEQNYLNLALAKRGQLTQKAFHYNPKGPESLFVPFARHPSMSISAGEVFYHLGLTSIARRYFSEAQGAIPNHYLSVRYIKRLAEIDMINGDWESAAKYLRVLQKTLFYDDWATEMLNKVVSRRDLSQCLELEEIRGRILDDNYISFEDSSIDVGELVNQHPNNRFVWDYLLMYYLYDKRMDLFIKSFIEYEKHFPGDIPQVYQEATLISWIMSHKTLKGFPYSATQYNKERLQAFISTYNSSDNAEKLLELSYSKTLWYYLFFY